MRIPNFSVRVSPLGSAEAAAGSPTGAKNALGCAATEIPGNLLLLQHPIKMEINLVSEMSPNE